MKQIRTLVRDQRGDAVVEATVLFPIIILICAALVLLSIYLPMRAAMQRSTQLAATAIATQRSDTWLRFDPDTLAYEWLEDRSHLSNVYASHRRPEGRKRGRGGRRRTSGHKHGK